ncbi:hypothetical protein Barb4_00011 [Bacteroidales bacterium Barb4]|nr:hypothetical protein Barb4_00011 [Bacteroidales bacterium Barb4]
MTFSIYSAFSFGNQGNHTKSGNRFFQIPNVISSIKSAFLKAKFIGLFLNDLQRRFFSLSRRFSAAYLFPALQASCPNITPKCPLTWALK